MIFGGMLNHVPIGQMEPCLDAIELNRLPITLMIFSQHKDVIIRLRTFYNHGADDYVQRALDAAIVFTVFHLQSD